MERIVCSWCQGQSDPGRTACEVCGAPLDVAALVTDSGWREAPRLKDMAEFNFGSSTCQVEGEIVPVAEVSLGAGDAFYFEHHVLLWKEETVPITAMNTSSRSFGGMPFVVTVAQGPGRVAVSRDAPGEMVVLPLHPQMEIDVREHAFLAASSSVGYSFVRIKGLANVLHGNGNVFERNLAAGEKIMLEPGAFLFKDSSVQMNVTQIPVKISMLRKSMYLAEMVGPGRVGIQSMYVHHGSD